MNGSSSQAPPAAGWGAKQIRNQEAKRIAAGIFGELRGEFHPLACQQVVRNLVKVCERELKTERVRHQIAMAGAEAATS